MTSPATLSRERIERWIEHFDLAGDSDMAAALRELLALREERAALREYVEHLDTDPSTSLFSSTKEHSEAWAKWQKKFKALRAKIGRSEGGQWEER